MYELYSFVYHHQTPKRASHWFLTCASQDSDRMIKYLHFHKCKFNHEEDQAWRIYVGEDRDIFTIEYAPSSVIQNLKDSTLRKGGLVVEPEAEVDVYVTYDSLSDEQILEIKTSGDIPCSDAQLICKISPILKANPRLAYYPETGRANENVVRVLKMLGFYESDGCLFCDF